MVKSFETKVRERNPIEFEVDGRVMTFTPPKRAELIASVIASVGMDGTSTQTEGVKDLLNWLGQGLSDDDGQWLLGRLNDPDDDFDLEQINEIARWLLGQTSGRPTKRR